MPKQRNKKTTTKRTKNEENVENITRAVNQIKCTITKREIELNGARTAHMANINNLVWIFSNFAFTSLRLQNVFQVYSKSLTTIDFFSTDFNVAAFVHFLSLSIRNHSLHFQFGRFYGQLISKTISLPYEIKATTKK